MILLVPELHRATDRLKATPEALALVADLSPKLVRHNRIGLATVAVTGEYYEPAEAGADAFITPAFWGGRLVDLVAWHPQTPHRWARRTGDADYLGTIRWRHEEGEVPLPVWRSPYSWFAALCEGIVPLAMDYHTLTRTLPATAQIHAEDRAHARELRRAMLPENALPRIVAA